MEGDQFAILWNNKPYELYIVINDIHHCKHNSGQVWLRKVGSNWIWDAAQQFFQTGLQATQFVTPNVEAGGLTEEL